MPTYTIQAPDGRKIKVEAPDEAAAVSGVQDYVKANPKADYSLKERLTYKPQMDAHDASSVRRESRKGDVPILDPVGDFVGPAAASLSALKKDFRTAPPAAPRNAREAGAQFLESTVTGPLRTGRDIAAATLSPLAGLLNQAVGPAARGMEAAGIGDEQINAPILNNSLMGSRARIVAPRPAPAPPMPTTPAAQALARRLPPAADMRAEAAAQRGAGVQPTLTDVSGGRGQRFVRAVGGKNEVAGEALEARARTARANTKPAAINRTRALTQDQRTPAQLAAETETARDAAAQTDYAPIYAQQIPVTPEAMGALLSETGQTAIRLARRSARDLDGGGQVVAELMQLDDAIRTGGQLPQTLSGQTLDYIHQTMGGLGRGFMRDPRTQKMGAGAFTRQGQVQTALDQAPALQPARQAYRESSRAIDVANGDNFMDPFTTDPTDYARWLGELPPQAQAANQVAVRQNLQEWLNGRPGPLGSLDEIAASPFGTENMRAVFGPQEADAYMGNIDALARQQRVAAEAAPSGGSRTAILGNDMQTAQNGIDVARIGVRAVRGDLLGAADGVLQWVRRAGINDELAQEIATLASDPTRLDEAVNLIEAARGQGAARQLRALVSHFSQGADQGLAVAGAAGELQPTQ